MSSLDRSLPAALVQRLFRFLESQRCLYAVLRSAVQVFAIRVVGAGLTYASMVFLARWLGAYNFGVYAYVVVIVTLLGLAFSFGFNSSTLRFIASYRARRKFKRLSGFLRQSYVVVLGLSVIGSLISAGLIFTFRDLFEPYIFRPLLIGLLCVPIWTLLNQLEATARAFQFVRLAYIPGYIVRPLSLMGLIGSIVWFGGAADAVIALWALVGACAIAALVQGLLVYFGVRRQLLDVKPMFHTRHWFTISLGFLMIDGFRMLLDNTDVLLIGKFLDPHSVAVYYAVIRTGGLIAFISFSMFSIAVPKFAELHGSGTRDELQSFVSEVVQLMFWPTLFAAFALALFGPFLLSLFGADFETGYPTLLVVLAGLVLRSATGPVEYLLSVTGHHQDTLRIYAVAAVANVALNVLLIPSLGILGAAIATYTAMLCGNVVLCRLAQRRLAIDAFALPFWSRRTRVTSRGALSTKVFVGRSSCGYRQPGAAPQ